MNRSGHVLVAGAINTDLVALMDRAPEPGETITGTGFSIHPGGKGGNQAVAVARSGVPVSILSAIGEDDFGSGRLDDLRLEGVDTASVSTVLDAPSGVAMIFVEASGENRIAYIPGATLRVSPDAGERAVRETPPACILATNELPLETLSALFTIARGSAIPVVLNATPDPIAARPLLDRASVLIVNEGEGRSLSDTARDATPEEVIAALQRLGPDGVVMTLGSDGAIGMDGAQAFHHRAPEVEVADTTGAGDAFCGAVVARLMAGATLSEATHYGVHAGALAVTRLGAQPSIPDAEAVRRFMAGTQAT
ncbi:MAG TPA: ribokinase [Thermomicrobiales bacterium]|nr:ribokinase [Thermomicrobiales bacterium]